MPDTQTALFDEVSEGALITDVVYKEYEEAGIQTILRGERNTYPDREVSFYYVETYVDGELVNNTGTVNNFATALDEYRLHLDLYHQITPEEAEVKWLAK